ncbi:phosphopantetheine-binding protein [Actinokineospora globicatena]|uniref:Carrier domain-containing protein n=1 Tax=Actinokineospora globicatena TaxID=103729 RepID=A0A9W6QKK1_9PSEU|nr:phosphopantetheine-binding protein [Actinokineospora globicatena]GLW89908.1 hypothetical protein Aglo03_07240 [Actinokineospora globicatena]
MTEDRERVFTGVFAAVLGKPGVGAHEGFFDAGGDSVLALQVVARAHEAGLAITVRDVFEHQTIALLAARAVPVDLTPTAAVLPEVTDDQLAEFADEDEGDVPVPTGWEREIT